VQELHERADARIWSILHGYVIRPAFCRRSAWFLPLLCSLGIPDAFPITLTRRNRRTRAVPEARRSDLALQRAVCMDCVGRIFALHSQLGRAAASAVCCRRCHERVHRVAPGRTATQAFRVCCNVLTAAHAPFRADRRARSATAVTADVHNTGRRSLCVHNSQAPPADARHVHDAFTRRASRHRDTAAARRMSRRLQIGSLIYTPRPGRDASAFRLSRRAGTDRTCP